jgi:hypothetical protein
LALKAGGTLPLTTTRLSNLAATKEIFAENVKSVHYQGIKALFTGS